MFRSALKGVLSVYLRSDIEVAFPKRAPSATPISDTLLHRSPRGHCWRQVAQRSTLSMAAGESLKAKVLDRSRKLLLILP